MERLMKQAKEIALALVEETQDVDLVLAYGSLGRGMADEFSDFDLLVLSDSVKVAWSFILNERPVSLWSMTWDEAEKRAKGILGSWCVGTSFLTHFQILWSKSKQFEARFQRLSTYISEGSVEVLRRHVTNATCLYGQLWKLQDAIRRNDTLTPAFLVWNIANSITQVLSALNKRPLINNWGKQLSEMAQFEIAPTEFISRYTELLTRPPETVLSLATSLIKEVYELIKAWFRKLRLSESNFVHVIEREWEGTLDYINKIRSAAKSQNLIAARSAAVEFTEFALWLFQGLRGRESNVRQFEMAHDVLGMLPSEHQVLLGTLLNSMDLDRLVEAAASLTNLLQSEVLAAGAKLPYVKSVAEAQPFLQISKLEK